MDKDQVAGKFDQAIGKAKESIGSVLGNDKLANEGVADQVKGAAKETWGNAKDAAQTVYENRLDENKSEAAEKRSTFMDKVAEVKQKVNERIDDFKEHEREKHAANS